MEWRCPTCHMRAIGDYLSGDRTYTANHKIVDGEVKDETIQTSIVHWSGNQKTSLPGELQVRFRLAMDEEEVTAFNKDWEDNWHPMIAERSTGVMKTFFEKLDDFPKYH